MNWWWRKKRRLDDELNRVVQLLALPETSQGRELLRYWGLPDTKEGLMEAYYARFPG